MKKLIIIVAMLLTLGTAAHSESFSMGSVITQVDKKSPSDLTKTAKKTNEKHTTKSGESYDIYLSQNGRAFVVRISKKTGNAYKQYLGEEKSRKICKKMGVEYK